MDRGRTRAGTTKRLLRWLDHRRPDRPLQGTIGNARLVTTRTDLSSCSATITTPAGRLAQAVASGALGGAPRESVVAVVVRTMSALRRRPGDHAVCGGLQWS